jgi:hypothetical protein
VALADGSVERPFVSLNDAVDAVRALPQAQRCAAGGVIVSIAGGVYGGIRNQLSLSAEDSGCGQGAPVVYRSVPTDATPVVLHGGAAVPPSAFKEEPHKTPGGLTIWSADLKSLGLGALAATSANFKTGWTCANGNRTEFFFGGKAMTLARHPNKEAGSEIWQYLRQGATLSSSEFDSGTDDTADGAKIPASMSAQWAHEVDDLWVHGELPYFAQPRRHASLFPAALRANILNLQDFSAGTGPTPSGK